MKNLGLSVTTSLCKGVPSAVLWAMVTLLVTTPFFIQDVRANQADGSANTYVVGSVTGLPLPRFVSLKKDLANIRNGPGSEHRVKWVLARKGLPLEVTAEHEHWRRVRDREGAEGWIYFRLLDGRRTLYVLDQRLTMYKKADVTGDIVAYLEPGVIVRSKMCDVDWCQVSIDGLSGWLQKTSLWGVYPSEVFD